MSAFTRKAKNPIPGYDDWDLWLRCDSCGREVLVYEHETDRLSIHNYIHSHGWRTRKTGDKWENLCPDCKDEKKQRETDCMNDIEQRFFDALMQELFKPEEIDSALMEFEFDNCVDIVHSPSKYSAIIEEIRAQWAYKIYRADFLIKTNWTPQYRLRDFIVEIDGQEYHKTKAQRQEDYERERFFQKNGYAVIRFTGSEVFTDARRCAKETLAIVKNEFNATQTVSLAYNLDFLEWIYANAKHTKQRKEIVHFIQDLFERRKKDFQRKSVV